LESPDLFLTGDGHPPVSRIAVVLEMSTRVVTLVSTNIKNFEINNVYNMAPMKI
jgi:hypothetical protein